MRSFLFYFSDSCRFSAAIAVVRYIVLYVQNFIFRKLQLCEYICNFKTKIRVLLFTTTQPSKIKYKGVPVIQPVVFLVSGFFLREGHSRGCYY